MHLNLSHQDERRLVWLRSIHTETGTRVLYERLCPDPFSDMWIVERTRFVDEERALTIADAIHGLNGIAQ